MLDSSQFNSGMGNLIRLLGLTEAVGNTQDLFDLSGTLLDENGNPIANATLNVSQSTPTTIRSIATSTTKTDSEGRFNLRLKIGIFNIQVSNSTGASLGNILITATSLNTTPTVSVVSGNFIVTISAFNSGTSSSPSGLSFAGSPYILLQGLSISSQTPTYSGSVTSCSVSPALPTGLSLNTTTCVLSGTPSNIQNSTNYTITATNSIGSSTASISISIQSPNNYIVSMPTGLLKTGQTTSYTTGDDGTYQKGASRTFTTGGTNGLIWQRCSAGQNNDATCSGTAQTYSWDQANSYCNTLSLGGRAWRLPNVNELMNLVEYINSNPPLINSNSYPNTEYLVALSSYYWSSTNSALIVNGAYSVYFGSAGGLNNYQTKTSLYYTRCISGNLSAQVTLTDNGNGTITDSTSGLIWQKCTAGQGTITGDCSTGGAVQYSWSNAISYCEALNLGNRLDWRLPNINEITTIIDFTKSSGPLINSNIFPNTISNAYYSSTTVSYNTNNAWVLAFWYGGIGWVGNKTTSVYIRCVTGP